MTLAALLLLFRTGGRLVVQTGPALTGDRSADLATAVSLISEKERVRLVAYRDIVRIPTTCA